MAIRELYSEFCKTPFPRDISENENLADILHELRMYDDYTAATIDKYISGVKIDSSELVYDNTIETQLKEFISDANNSNEDVSAAKQYLQYVLRIKEIFELIEK